MWYSKLGYLFPHKMTEKGVRLPQVVNQTLHRHTVLFKEGTHS